MFIVVVHFGGYALCHGQGSGNGKVNSRGSGKGRGDSDVSGSGSGKGRGDSDVSGSGSGSGNSYYNGNHNGNVLSANQCEDYTTLYYDMICYDIV